MQKIRYACLLLFFLVAFAYRAVGQCPTDTILYFTTQAEVDAFVVEYPGCTEYGGSVEVYHPSGTDITSLQGLQNLTFIGGDFLIKNNAALTNMNGLENLISVGRGIRIEANTALNSLAGLEKLNSIERDFWIGNNGALTSMTGLENLTSIGRGFYIINETTLASLGGLENLASIGDRFVISDNDVLSNMNGLNSLTSIGEDFFIYYNDALTSFCGLENLTSIGWTFEILGNPVLTNIDCLKNLTSIGGYIWIVSNFSLSLCDASFVCNYFIYGNIYVDIYDNAPGCNDAYVIPSQCGDIGNISLHYYYDENQNAIQDNNEAYLPVMSATITPGNYTLAGNPSGAAIKYLYYGDYTITINEATSWTLTSSSTTYNITLNSLNTSDTLYFGLIPNTFISNLSTTCVNALPRCNEYVLFEPMLINNGTTIADGILWFETDENILDVNFIDVPDTIVGNNYYGWFFTELYPQQVFKKSISLQLPGPPAFPIEDEINVITSAIYADQNNSEAFVIDNVHRVEIQCSFDPNDKLVQTSNDDNNYALIGEDLIYTIRFQNTGNAEAYDVVIKDLLSEDLDLSTFRVIASSHDTVLSTYLNDRMLTFEFRDIFLPDSTTNFEASQGYVMYSIRALDTLADFTEIENTAHIFFDYNPAVITNTTENLMVESFDLDGDGFELWLDCDDLESSINPSAIEVAYNGMDEDCNLATPDDDLDWDGIPFADDCDDNNPLVTGTSEEMPYNGIDDDCDPGTLDDDLDEDGVPLIGDCDDTNSMVNYNMEEIAYNGLDDDCNLFTLDDDLDQDGFVLADDCDDNDPLVTGTSGEIPYNGLDDDCDPATLDDDLDGDGVPLIGDCDDANPMVNYNMEEIAYNGLDDDCNIFTLDDDLDQDGFVLANDCDDNDAAINTAATEIPNNGIDEDCDGNDLIINSTQDFLSIPPQIFPNPTTGGISILLPYFTQAKLSIKDYTGKTIKKKYFEQETKVDISTLPVGMYVFLIQTTEGIWTERVVKL